MGRPGPDRNSMAAPRGMAGDGTKPRRSPSVSLVRNRHIPAIVGQIVHGRVDYVSRGFNVVPVTLGDTDRSAILFQSRVCLSSPFRVGGMSLAASALNSPISSSEVLMAPRRSAKFLRFLCLLLGGYRSTRHCRGDARHNKRAHQIFLNMLMVAFLMLPRPELWPSPMHHKLETIITLHVDLDHASATR
jgi:hypothetical protein